MGQGHHDNLRPHPTNSLKQSCWLITTSSVGFRDHCFQLITPNDHSKRVNTHSLPSNLEAMSPVVFWEASVFNFAPHSLNSCLEFFKTAIGPKQHFETHTSCKTKVTQKCDFSLQGLLKNLGIPPPTKSGDYVPVTPTEPDHLHKKQRPRSPKWPPPDTG